jgi:1,4-alpha-glucan branching enzyme
MLHPQSWERNIMKLANQTAPPPGGLGAAGEAPLKSIRFVLIRPEAHEVFVAGSFNNWNPGATPLEDVGHGHWVKDLALAPGRYEYQFVADGHWMPDATAPESVENPFGGLNSVLVVSQPKALPAKSSGAAAVDLRHGDRGLSHRRSGGK